MPLCGPRRPVQVTDVPRKVTDARAPVAVDVAAVPPLHALVVSVCHAPLKATAGNVSSSREKPCVVMGGFVGATSNASTATAKSPAQAFGSPVSGDASQPAAPCLRPVASTRIVCDAN